MKISERYQLFEEIGQGGMGTVYRAWDQELHLDVALKLLLGYLSKDETFTRRFYREAEIVSRLEHPHIVPIYDVGTYENRSYLVMRLLTGGTLRDRVQQGGLSSNALWAVMQQVASALDMAHDRQVVHRDIKPTNILFDETGQAYVADFGIARFTDMTSSLTGSTALGTPAYMSPEQFTGRDMGGAADQYALAVLIYEMLVGKLPFSGDTVQVMYKHLNEPPPLAYSLNPDVSQAVSIVLQRGMAKKPADRFPSVTAFVQALAGSNVANIPVPDLTPEPASTGKRRRQNPDYEEGLRAFQRKEWAAAAMAFDRVLAVDPQNQGVRRLKQEAERHLLHETGQRQPGTVSEGYRRSQMPMPTPAKPARPVEVVAPKAQEAAPPRSKSGVVAGAGGEVRTKRRGVGGKWLWIGAGILLILGAVGALALALASSNAVVTRVVTRLATDMPDEIDDTSDPGVVLPIPILVGEESTITVVQATEGVTAQDGDGAETIRLSAVRSFTVQTNRVYVRTPSDEQQTMMAELSLPDGNTLFLGVNTEIIILSIATQNEATETMIRLEQGYMLALTGAPLIVENPYGVRASALNPGMMMGVSYLLQPFRMDAHCLEGTCLLTGDLGGQQILHTGESSWVGASGQPGRIEGADYLLWSQVGLGIVPTATATRRVAATSTAITTPVPTATGTPRPRATSSPTITVTPTPIPPNTEPLPTARPQPTNTPVPPTNTPVLLATPTYDPYPNSTSTPVSPTNTPMPPTNTPVPPTNTPVPTTPAPTWPTSTWPPVTLTPGIASFSD